MRLLHQPHHYADCDPMTITKTLKERLAASGLSHRAIERATGVLRQTTMRFMKGNGSIRLDQADKLAKLLKLELRDKGQP